ncbi:hypothetical protein ACIHAR_37530 [Streptomyces sp. NPDC052016]|uniref:hypothetical protein n=1 Tax=Streptomyces sp. NPDC052016 TaxID=3365680 RepID=UPI0037D651DB
MIKDSRQAKSVDQQLRHAAAQVKFINKWTQTRRLSEQMPDAQGVRDWLDDCLKSAERQMVAAQPREKPAGMLRLLMLESLKSRTAQFARVLFWLSLFFVNFTAITGTVDVVSGYKGEDALTLSETVASVIIFGALSASFRGWARAAENQFRTKAGHE